MISSKIFKDGFASNTTRSHGAESVKTLKA